MLKHLLHCTCAFILFSCISSVASAQDKVGDLSATVKYIEAEKLYPFSQGVAVINKGQSYAVIDTNGNFVIPYNKYQIISRCHDGMMIVYDAAVTRRYLIVNTSGKVLGAAQYGTDPISDGYCQSPSEKNTITYTNAKGEKIVDPPWITVNRVACQPGTDWSEGLCKICGGSNMPFGYMDRHANLIIPPVYERAENFSQGLAVVGRKNEFGEMKFGFINKANHLVIPLKYASEPGPFHANRAAVYTINSNEFDFGFINQQDELVIKALKKDFVPLTTRMPVFSDAGFALLEVVNIGQVVMDTTGHWVKLDDFVHACDKQGSLAGKSSAQTTAVTMYDRTMYVKFGDYSILIDLDKKEFMFPPYPFQSIYDGGCYDVFSKYTLVEKEVGSPKSVAGYVDRNGVFKIVMREQSAF